MNGGAWPVLFVAEYSRKWHRKMNAIDSTINNVYVQAQIAGGGSAPIWRFHEWRTGAIVGFYTPTRSYQIYLPEGAYVEYLVAAVAHSWDALYRAMNFLKRRV